MKDKPAFPTKYLNGNYQARYRDGMTLREWYAGMALQGLIVDMRYDTNHDADPEIIATTAFELADAMLGVDDD